MYVFPTDKQIEDMTADGEDQPVLMVNLVRLRENAFYPEDSGFGPCSGAEAFDTYVAAAGKVAAEVGVKLLVADTVRSIFIGPEDEKWDRFYLLWYPSTQVFLELLTMPEFIVHSIHRTAGLLDARMMKCDATSLNF